MDNYKKENEFQTEALDNLYYKLQQDGLKSKKYVYNSFPLVHKNSVEMSDIRNCVYADAFTRYLNYKGNNVLFTTGINNTSKKIYDSVLGNVLSKEDPYTNLKEKSYEDLIKMDILVDPDRRNESHSKRFINFIQDAFIKLYKYGHITKEDENFYLDFSRIKEEVLTELNQKSMFDELKHALDYKVGISLMINTTSEFPFEIIIENPEQLCALNFIAIKPSVAARNYYLDSEVEFIKDYIKNKKGMGIFSGNFAINPITLEHIPIIVSHYYEDSIHLGMANLHEKDLLFTSLLGLGYKEVLSKEKTLINSAFLDGLSFEDARAKTIEYLVTNCNAKTTESFNTKLLISTEFEDGISIPFYENECIDLSDLPVLIDSKNNVRTLNGKLPKNKVSNKVFTTNITQAFLNIATRAKDETGFTNYSSTDFILDFKEFPKCNYAIFNSKADYFFTLVLNMIILKSINVEYKNIFERFYITQEVIETKNMIELTAVLSRFGACSLRMNMLSIDLEDNYYYNVDNVMSCSNNINKFLQIYNFEFVHEFKDLEKDFQSLISNTTQLLELNDLPMYIELIDIFIEKVLVYKKITSRQAKGLLVLYSLIAPSVCEDVFKNKFKKNYPLMFDAWPDLTP